MATEVILIRHGETVMNETSKYQGHSDIPLNKRGEMQANLLARALKSEDIDKIYCSDLKRTIETAKRIGSFHQLIVHSREELREINFGQWEGLTYQQICQQYPQIAKTWFDDPVTHKPPRGENLLSFAQRITACLQQIVAESDEKKIIVVTHGGTIRVWLAQLLGMALDQYWKLDISTASISRLKLYGENPVLTELNCTCHLMD